MAERTRIGFLGTGIMGGHMARRLAAAGFRVSAWNRTRARADALAGHGVTLADTAARAAKDADVVIVMVSDGPAVEEVVFAPGGAASAMATGATLVVMSSIPVEACRDQAARLAPAGIGYVDAPVSGGEVGAREGTLAILAGGQARTVTALAPVFAALGRATRIGDVGAGQLAKLANQIIVGGTMAAVAEAMHFARAGGADVAALRAALMGGFGGSRILDIHGARMASGDFAPGSPAKYQLKDMATALALAQREGVGLTVLPFLVELFGGMIANGDGDIDVSGVIREIARRGG